MSFQTPWNADQILDEKNSPEQRSLFAGDLKKRIKMLETQHKLFLKFNDNSLIYYFSNQKEIRQFAKSWDKFYNSSVGESKKETEKALKEFRKKGLTKNRFESTSLIPDNSGFAFFNPSLGLEVITQKLEWFPDPDNPFFTKVDKTRAFFTLLMDSVFSKELIHYLLAKNKPLTLRFPGEPRDNTLHKNLDFMLRFWKHDSYFEEPKVIVL